MARKPTRRPRRKPGSGTIRYRPSRPLPYEASFPLGHSKYRCDSFATREDAAAHLDRLTAERDDRTHPRNIAGGSQRLDRFLTDWLTIKKPHIKAKTFQDYRYQCDLAVGYLGGETRIDSISRKDADLLYATLHQSGYKNVSQLRMVLAQAFDYAEEEDYVRGNPFKRAHAPHVERKRPIVLTKAQREHMLATATGDALEALWHLYSRLALRRGEGIGLLWANIDWKEQTISITQHYTVVGAQTVQSTPKTKRSRRTFPVPGDIIALLRQLQVAQLSRATADPRWELSGLVFTDDRGQRLTAGHVRSQWLKLKKKAGITARVTIHGLRHTALYHMEQAGIPESVRMAFAGQASPTMARHYADHATEDIAALRAALEKMG